MELDDEGREKGGRDDGARPCSGREGGNAGGGAAGGVTFRENTVRFRVSGFRSRVWSGGFRVEGLQGGSDATCRPLETAALCEKLQSDRTE